jgi:hypothetical protein
MTVSIFMWHGK